MHWIQVLVAPMDVLARAVERAPSATICPLEQGLALLPITLEVEAELSEGRLDAFRPIVPHSGDVAQGVGELASSLSEDSFVLYLATYIHGGTGGQDAILWKGGDVVLSIGDDEDNMSKWPDSPISRALRQVGVTAQPDQDEFDAIGLGRFRSNESWAEAHSLA
jgi:hypothetical protein